MQRLLEFHQATHTFQCKTCLKVAHQHQPLRRPPNTHSPPKRMQIEIGRQTQLRKIEVDIAAYTYRLVQEKANINSQWEARLIHGLNEIWVSYNNVIQNYNIDIYTSQVFMIKLINMELIAWCKCYWLPTIPAKYARSRP